MSQSAIGLSALDLLIDELKGANDDTGTVVVAWSGWIGRRDRDLSHLFMPDGLPL